MDEHTYTVGDLAERIAEMMWRALPGEVWVSGQIRGLPSTRQAEGHLYFELVDPVAPGVRPSAVLPVTFFAQHRDAVNKALSRGGAARMEDGVEVRIRGRVSFYAPRGTVQVLMTGIDPAYTVGRLAAARAELIGALAAEGLLTRNKELPVPAVPLSVGLVTSVASAAYGDFVAELATSGYSWRVRTVDTRVQGSAAEGSIVSAIDQLARAGVDVIALVRGGGAQTDLVVFDSPPVARAIASASVPVLTGIGHEIDRSVADEVAHLALKTPTACAAHLVSLVAAFDARLGQLAARAGAFGDRALRRTLARLDDSGARVARAGMSAARHADQRLGHATGRLCGSARLRLSEGSNLVDSVGLRIAAAGPRRVAAASRWLEAVSARAAAHDPQRLRAKGWSITRTEDGMLVRSAADIASGDTLVTTLAQGTVESLVTALHPGPADDTIEPMTTETSHDD